MVPCTYHRILTSKHSIGPDKGWAIDITKSAENILFLFDLILYVSVNSYGHVEMVSSLINTFSWASFT